MAELYTVQDSETNKTVTFEWTGRQPPTDDDMIDVFAESRRAEPVESTTEQAVGGLKAGLREAATTLENIARVYPLAETAATIIQSSYGIPASGLAGLVTLPIAAAAKGLGLTERQPLKVAASVVAGVQKALIYQPHTIRGEQLTQAATYPFKLLEQAGKYAGEKIDDPNIAAAVDTLIVGAPSALLWRMRGTAPKPQAIAKRITKAVDRGIDKGVRPPVSGKQTFSQIAKYRERAKVAVKEIIKLKDDIRLTDVNGEVVSGLPKTLNQFSQAIEQVRKRVFEEYDGLVRKADGKGVQIDTSNIVQELVGIATDKQVNTFNPGVAKYAADFAERLAKEPFQTAQEIQNGIAILNDRLSSFYKNPSYENASHAYVDSVVANNLRKAVDAKIESTVGGQYQSLKNVYGALKAIEKDVNHRSIVNARKNIRGLIDFTDVFTSSEVVLGILSGNPAIVGKGIAGKIVAALTKRVNDPNRIIKKMFSEVESQLKRQALPKIPVSTKFEGPTADEPTRLLLEHRPMGEGTIELPAGPIETLRTPIPGSEYYIPYRPKKIITKRGTLEEGVTDFSADVAKQIEALRPDQLSTVREGKAALSKAIEREAGIGGPPLKSKGPRIAPFTAEQQAMQRLEQINAFRKGKGLVPIRATRSKNK